MRILGLYLASGQFRYSVLEGTKNTPTLLTKDRMITPSPDLVPEFMDWYETEFKSLLEKYSPDSISFRQTLELKKKQLVTSAYPIGILYLLAFQKSISVSAYTSRSFVASKLNLPKGTDIFTQCDIVFGKNPPYWDTNQKYSILTAWFDLQ